MARFARPSVMVEDPSAHVGSLVGSEAARENMLRSIPQFRVLGESVSHLTKMD